MSQAPPPGYYAIDLRLFLALIIVTMAGLFFAGVVMVPPNSDLIQKAAPKSEEIAEVRDAYLLNMSDEDVKANDEHRPSGQHLLVDIKGVEGDFLNSEECLSKAMVDTVNESGLTLLSYHCHSLLPAGVSCVGVLLESHISFHTWPDEGVITLDLFTCGSKPLLPAVATIERLFGIGENTKTQWSHELRGFRPDEEKRTNYLADSSDLSLWILSPLEMHSKTQIFAGETNYQRVDIWDIVEVTDTPSYDDVKKHNMTAGDPRLNSPDYTTPDRLLFLDGTIQSIRSSEKIYHEAMVHPAMFAHPKPKHVAILGGGEGATLREVLKHKTIESATMIEIDEELVKIAREYLPGFSDCSNLVGRSANCFDDDLVTVNYADGRQWFIDRFGFSPTEKHDNPFDVIIIDALDPEDDSVISDMLYNDDNFLSSLVNSLSDEGVLVIQVGTAATIDDPRPDFGVYKKREILFNMLEKNKDVEAMLVYEEPHCGFLEPHAFLVICKSAECRSRWYARSDQVDYEIYDRIVRTHNKQRALTFFDGTTQRYYQYPKKGWETVYCRREPTPFECSYRFLNPKAEFFEMDLENKEESAFSVETETNDKGETVTRVFAEERIPKGSYIMAEHLASSLQLTTRNLEGLKSNLNVGGGRVAIIEDLLGFFDEYAHESAMEGSKEHYVEVGGTVLIRRADDESQANVGPWVPPHPAGKRPKFSPVYERHRMSFDVFMVATRDIEEEEELLMPKSMWSKLKQVGSSLEQE
jgi:S-adenosylmethionine decarboxylase proenzyme